MARSKDMKPSISGIHIDSTRMTVFVKQTMPDGKFPDVVPSGIDSKPPSQGSYLMGIGRLCLTDYQWDYMKDEKLRLAVMALAQAVSERLGI